MRLVSRLLKAGAHAGARWALAAIGGAFFKGDTSGEKLVVRRAPHKWTAAPWRGSLCDLAAARL